MSTLTKVFIILLFVLSLVYLGMTSVLFSLRVDYKRMYNEVQVQKDAEIKVYQEEVEKYKGERNSLQQTSDQLRAQKAAVTAQYDAIQKELSLQREELNKRSNELSQITEENKKLMEELSAERDENRNLTAQRDDAWSLRDQALAERESMYQQLIDSQNQRDMLEVQYNQLYERHMEVMKELEDTERQLAWITERTKNMPGLETASIVPVENIEGRIQGVSKYGFVIVSCGHSQNVKPGYKFTVSRNGNFIGIVSVDEVIDDNHSSAIVNPDMLKEPIKVGDRINIVKE